MIRVARATIVVVCLIGGLLATAAPALATTISVDVGADDSPVADGDCSLREAVEAANTNAPVDTCLPGTAGLDTISLPDDLLIEVISPNGQIDITEALVIQGVSSAATVIDLSGAGDDGFEVAPGIEATFRALAVDGDGNPHEAIDNRGDLTLDEVLFSGNDNPNEGGAVSSVGSLTVTDSTFEDNHSDIFGGAIFQDGGDLTITESTFDGNTALLGGAVAAIEADVEINGTSEFTGNTAGIFGGALFLDGGFAGGTALIEGAAGFSTNTAGLAGGGVYMAGIDLTIRGADFVDNVSLDAGGGLFADCTCAGGSLSIEDSEFTGNEAQVGGGAVIVGAASITGATFTGNSATLGGGALVSEAASNPEYLGIQESHFDNNSAPVAGAIAAEETQLYVTDSTLHQNHATGGDPDEGGGAINAFLSTVVLERTTVSDNDAVVVGGGIQAVDGQVDIANSTVTGNSVSDGAGQGGGVHLSEVDAHLIHSTITDNSAPGAGGGVWTDGLVETLTEGTIIAENPAGGNCNMPLEDDHPNLDSDGSCFPASGVGSITADPMLGPLDDNGGPTDTHALLSGSPALNFADGGPCSELSGVDQRGESRPSGGACDLGAYERQVAPPPPPTPKHTLSVTTSGPGVVTSGALGIDCGTGCTADHDEGTTGVLTAVPDVGAEFTGWEGDCVTVDGDECTVEMDGDREVTATFADLPPIPSGRCRGMEYGSSNVLRDGTRMIAGTTGDDDLQGSGRPDVICGLQGNDTLRGKSGGDILLGGSGDDELIGGKGPDRLNGGPGTDTCRGGKGKNKFIACE